MTGLRMSEEEFKAMTNKNPNLKIASNSAHNGVVITQEQRERYERIRATEQQAGSGKRVNTIKKAKTSKNKDKPYVSPHAIRLAQFANNPDNIPAEREHYNQVRIFDDLERNHPDIYALASAVPNGGIRDDKTAGKMRAEGQKKGYPDIVIDAARGIYHGFRLELKAGKGRASEEQKAYHELLRRNGYCVVLCWEYEAAMTAILEYWSLSAGGVMTSEIYK